jgi:ElaB/YqjD/DUF883 family membrane-anchored ribosome-binding protein
VGSDAERPAGEPAESASAQALRTIDEVRSLLEGASTENLAERAAAVREKLGASREALEQAVQQTAGPLGEALLGAERSLHAELEEVEQRIRDNPLGALLAAAAVGLLLGVLISRHR